MGHKEKKQKQNRAKASNQAMTHTKALISNTDCKINSLQSTEYNKRKGTNTLHSMVNGEGLSASLGKAETEESTTICFS
jgi:hypothetical protein